MGKTQDRTGMDLTEAEEIKKRWQEYTEELYKKVLMTWITMMVWLSSWHSPRANILECEVKWALGSITTNKANEGDGIPAEPFKVLKHDAVKVLLSVC